MIERITSTPAATMELGEEFGSTLNGGDVVAVSGTLGAGKTCFIQGVCKSLGVHTHVGSPTFTLINEYPGTGPSVVHVDLYRIAKGRELRELGLLEYFTSDRICLIEWPELVLSILPEEHYAVVIRHGSTEAQRIVTIDRVVA